MIAIKLKMVKKLQTLKNIEKPSPFPEGIN